MAKFDIARRALLEANRTPSIWPRSAVILDCDAVITDIDIYRSANELIEQHGEDAPLHAAMRADELLENGDLEGKAVWVRVLRATEYLLSDKVPDGVNPS